MGDSSKYSSANLRIIHRFGKKTFLLPRNWVLGPSEELSINAIKVTRGRGVTLNAKILLFILKHCNLRSILCKGIAPSLDSYASSPYTFGLQY